MKGVMRGTSLFKLLLGGAGGGKSWAKCLIPIRSSDCMCRYICRFQGQFLYRPIVLTIFKYQFFNKPIQFLALSSNFCIDRFVLDSLKSIVSLHQHPKKYFMAVFIACLNIFFCIQSNVSLCPIFPGQSVYWCGFNRYIFEYRCPTLPHSIEYMRGPEHCKSKKRLLDVHAGQGTNGLCHSHSTGGWSQIRLWRRHSGGDKREREKIYI